MFAEKAREVENNVENNVNIMDKYSLRILFTHTTNRARIRKVWTP